MLRDSFCCPKVVFVSALNALSLHVAVVFMLFMCCEKVICVSSVMPSILGFLSSGSC